MMGYVIALLSEPTERTSPREYPNINYGLWVIMVRFILSNKCTPLVSDADNGEAVRMWGQGLHGKAVPAPEVCSELKTIPLCSCEHINIMTR